MRLRPGRAGLGALLAAILAASCTQGGVGSRAADGMSGSSSPALTSTTSSSNTDPSNPPEPSREPQETTEPPVPADPAAPAGPPIVSLRLAPAEALAARHGIEIRVGERGGVLGTLTAERPVLEVPLDALPGTLEFAYAGSAGGEPAWTQEVPVGATGVEVSQPWRADPPSGSAPIALVWQALGDRADYIRQLDRALPHVTVVAPIWWYVQADGSVSDRSDARYVAEVHERGVAIWPAVAGLDADANHAMLADPEQRGKAASQISERAREIGADGVNVDIEGFRDEDGPAFTEFMRELTTLVHEWGGVVSYDLIPRTDRWEVSPPELAFWSTAPERRALAEIADYTVIMAYDEHNRFRPDGPVASPPWVDDVVTYALRFVDPHRLILGVPFYGRIWDPAALDAPRAVGVGALAATAAGGVGSPDSLTGLERIELPDGRYLWLEGPEVIAARLDLVDRLGLAGWAAWRLGFDSAALWEALGSR